MMSVRGEGAFKHLEIKPVINCCGVYTDFGGSRLSPKVWAAMEEMNQSFVAIPTMLDRTGKRIASLLGSEAAVVTPGAAAAIMLGTAACMAGADGSASERLPDTTGVKNQVLIQAGHRYKYDRQVTMTGASLVEVGTENGTRTDQIESAITADTAMFIYPAHLEGKPGTLSIDEVAGICAANRVPLFVDAAYMCYPTNTFASYIARGADFVAVSSKYFGGPNAGGFLLGKQALIDNVTNVYFTRYESGSVLKYGRPLKMDRQTVAAVVVALEEWLETDHDERLKGYETLVDALQSELSKLPGLSLQPMYFTLDERLIPSPVNCLVVGFEDGCGMSADQLADRLMEGDRPIAAIPEGDKLIFAVDVATGEEINYVGQRVIEIAKATA